MASTSAFLNRGDIVANRYRIDTLLGQGGMGVVFQAVHIGTDHIVALKLLHPHLVRDPKVRAMFAREARVGARIKKNPHLVEVFDTGLDSRHGVAYIAMEYLKGMTLEEYVDDVGPMPPTLLLTLWQQLGDVLTQAHTAGVVHRDLKPSNLFVTLDYKKQPRLVVLDFGIAKLIESNMHSPVTPVGTPAYAAPEQRGYVGNAGISAATDIWAFGIITYELLSGNHPESLWQIQRVDDSTGEGTTDPTTLAISQACQSTNLLPQNFDAWLAKSLAPNPDDRWQCVQDAVCELAKLFQAEQLSLEYELTPSPSIITEATQRVRQNRNTHHHRHKRPVGPHISNRKQGDTAFANRMISAFTTDRIKKSGLVVLVSAIVVLIITLKWNPMNSTGHETPTVERPIPTAAPNHAPPLENAVHALAQIHHQSEMTNEDGAGSSEAESGDSLPVSSDTDATIKLVSTTKCVLLIDGKPGGDAPVEKKVSSSRQHRLTIHCKPDHFGFCDIKPTPGAAITLEIFDPVRQFDKSRRFRNDCSIWQQRQ